MRNDDVRTLRRLGACLIGAMFVWAVGCGGGHGEEGCGELCERSAECAGAAPDTLDVCTKGCTEQTEVAEEKGCGDAYTGFLECVGHADDVCDEAALNAECKIQSDAFVDCLGG